MKKALGVLVALALGVTLLVTKPASAAFDEVQAEQIFAKEVKDARIEADRRLFKISRLIRALARTHSLEMIEEDEVSHFDFEERREVIEARIPNVVNVCEVVRRRAGLNSISMPAIVEDVVENGTLEERNCLLGLNTKRDLIGIGVQRSGIFYYVTFISARRQAKINASIDDVSVDEGRTGANTVAQFTISMDFPLGRPTTFLVSTRDGSASAPGDYTQQTLNAVTIDPGETSKTFDVTVVGDGLIDGEGSGEETFDAILVKDNRRSVRLLDRIGTATIVDEEDEIEISIADAPPASEGDLTQTFTVTLSDQSGVEIKVDADTADDSASQPDDYLTNAETLTFVINDDEETFTVTLADDVIQDGALSYNVNLSNVVGPAFILDGQGVGLINDND